MPRFLSFRHGVLLACTFAVFALGFAESASAQTNVSGTISSNTTWTAAGSPWVMTGNVTVTSGVTLTIEPGVTVQGNAGSRILTINGSLIADGTGASGIVFTSSTDSAPGQWTGITFGSSAGVSSMKFVEIRFGGGSGASQANGMVTVNGGDLTVEDSLFTGSTVSGMRVAGPSNGTGVEVSITRSKFEDNGFGGASDHGNGLIAFSAPVVVDDSAFWSNADDGIRVEMSSSYSVDPSEITDSSMWDNGRYGAFVLQGVGADDLGPDASGNAIYDNGEFTFTIGNPWTQVSVSRNSDQMDWSGNYWGPVTFLPCSGGLGNGHLSFGVPDPDPTDIVPVPRGPISHSTVSDGAGGWCGDDDAVGNPPLGVQPDLFFDPPPPTFGGLLFAMLFGCRDCLIHAAQIASGLDAAGGNPAAHTPQPVNTATGSLAEVATDLRLAGPGIPFAWIRSYNSLDTTVGGLGTGWTHPYEASITVINPTTGELEYRAGSGSACASQERPAAEAALRHIAVVPSMER